MGKARILVVEDEAVIATRLGERLTSMGYQFAYVGECKNDPR